MPYRLLQPDGKTKDSPDRGQLAGNATLQIYGKLDCARAVAALPAYAKHRVFFRDEGAAIAAGFRPCARCMPERYAIWKAGPGGSASYPWRILPKHPTGA